MKLIILIALCAVLILLSTGNSYACSCLPAPAPRQALKEATAVFVGEVVSKEVFDVTDQFGAQPLVRVKFAVSRTWKGIKGTEAIVHTSAWNPACGFNFERGKTYLVYAYPDHWKLNALATGLCNRTVEIEKAKKDLRAIGRGREATKSAVSKIFPTAL